MYNPYTPPQSSVAPLHVSPKIKWWMLVYSVIFAAWLALCAINSILANLSLIYIMPAAILYILTTSGNILYATNRSNIFPARLWQITLILITLEYFLRPMYGKDYGSTTHDTDILRTLKSHAINIALFIPTARAHYIISHTYSRPA